LRAASLRSVLGFDFPTGDLAVEGCQGPRGKLPNKRDASARLTVCPFWRYDSCKRVFTPASAALRNKTYPLRVVLDAITTYDLGYSTTERARLHAVRKQPPLMHRSNEH
jgi:hypothetical protein